MNFSVRSRNLEVKRSGSVLEKIDRAVSPRVTASGGEDNKKKLDAACFSASCGRAFSCACECGFMAFMVHITAEILCDRSQDLFANVGAWGTSLLVRGNYRANHIILLATG